MTKECIRNKTIESWGITFKDQKGKEDSFESGLKSKNTTRKEHWKKKKAEEVEN